MPFRSKSQFRKFKMLESSGKVPKGTVEEWLKETKNFKKLPERVKKAVDSSFSKIAKELFNPMKSPPIPAPVVQQNVIQATKQDKMGGMTPVEYRNELTSRRTGVVQKNKESQRA